MQVWITLYFPSSDLKTFFFKKHKQLVKMQHMQVQVQKIKQLQYLKL